MLYLTDVDGYVYLYILTVYQAMSSQLIKFSREKHIYETSKLDDFMV
jgi:hypothetical protein